MDARPRKDLVVLVPDKQMESAVRGILERRQSLRIRPVDADFLTHPERDPGCLNRGHELLRAFARSHDHALVLLDRKGCGSDAPAEELERRLVRSLSRSGWDRRADAIVLDPELENWVWADSPEVDAVLGWAGRKPDLRTWLRSNGHLRPNAVKPERPKEAFQAALRVVGQPRSSSLFAQLAGRVGLARCRDRAFLKLKARLREWFPGRS